MNMAGDFIGLATAWNVASQKNPMLSTVLKAKYFPYSSFWTANNTSTKPIF
jgi:hypothetical protein